MTKVTNKVYQWEDVQSSLAKNRQRLEISKAEMIAYIKFNYHCSFGNLCDEDLLKLMTNLEDAKTKKEFLWAGILDRLAYQRQRLKMSKESVAQLIMNRYSVQFPELTIEQVYELTNYLTNKK